VTLYGPAPTVAAMLRITARTPAHTIAAGDPDVLAAIGVLAAAGLDVEVLAELADNPDQLPLPGIPA
jgi:hypothetical protein